jgi:hypothetical protein
MNRALLLTAMVRLTIISPTRMHPETKTTPPVLQAARRFGIYLSVTGLMLIANGSIISGSSDLNSWTSLPDADSHPTITPKRTEERMNTPAPFYDVLRKALQKRKTKLEIMCPSGDPVARRVLEDYGAIFVASRKVTPPPVCVFTSEAQVAQFQRDAGVASEMINDDQIELQPEAMKALLKAREEANKEDLDITPRDGSEAARRNYDDSVRLWNTRFLPALDYWIGKGKLTDAQAERLRNLALHDQVAEVLELEKSEIYFSKDLSKSILYSIAAPGTSQHIAMLALDVTEFQNPRVRELLAKHGWFQTVLSDLPHFTFLGLKESDLPRHGLKSVVVDGQTFWIPNVPQ